MGLTTHASEQMEARGLLMGDVLHVLRNGFVYDTPSPAKQAGYWRYKMTGRSPNSGRREVSVIVIPQNNPVVGIVTVMWADER
ncbi:MAG: hypothetical protein COW30_02065 [Rhodospirillales bacterium CG15_BIG_FIL_POST_REV_8_21_14_020_66_15]|nr:MAG: hypothetical protein COW30_02065 [Rhodospirillales bacterium CG15_BIG_FIL_POST_REV_8_21_14_020_66_15]